MLTNKSFIKWANENVIVLIAHNELGHEEIVDEKVTGEDNRRCPLYPGMKCRDHLDVAVETDTSRDEELPVIPFVELCPNSWLVHPDGTVDPIEEKAQFVTKGIKDQAKALQKKLGDAQTSKRFTELLPHAEAANDALDEEAWRPALEALAKLRAGVKKPGKGLDAWISSRMELVQEEVEYTFEDVAEDEQLTKSEKRIEIAKLFKSVDVQVGGRHLGIRDIMAEWLKKNETGTQNKTGK